MCFSSVKKAPNFILLLSVSVKLMSAEFRRQTLKKKRIQFILVFSWFALVCSSFTVNSQKTVVNHHPRANATRIHYKKERLRFRQKQLVKLVNEAKTLLKRYPLKRTEFPQKDESIQTADVTPIPDHFQSGLWAVKLQFGEDDASREILDLSAEIIAKRHGLENHGQIGELKGMIYCILSNYGWSVNFVRLYIFEYSCCMSMCINHYRICNPNNNFVFFIIVANLSTDKAIDETYNMAYCRSIPLTPRSQILST